MCAMTACVQAVTPPSGGGPGSFHEDATDLPVMILVSVGLILLATSLGSVSSMGRPSASKPSDIEGSLSSSLYMWSVQRSLAFARRFLALSRL